MTKNQITMIHLTAQEELVAVVPGEEAAVEEDAAGDTAGAEGTAAPDAMRPSIVTIVAFVDMSHVIAGVRAVECMKTAPTPMKNSLEMMVRPFGVHHAATNRAPERYPMDA